MRHLKYIVVFGIILMFQSCGDHETSSREGVVFMENGRVFDEFAMKKEYDELIEKDLSSEASLVDSIAILLNQGEFTDSNEVYRLRKEYYLAEQFFNKKYDELSGRYTREVHERLNAYIEDFAKENGYDMIIGSGNGGNVMYISDEKNISDELIKYINKKYQP